MAPSPRRYTIVGITAVAALWMYIDRVCVSTVIDPIQTDLGLTDREKARALGAFFLTYALMQVPVGALADRFGRRRILAACIVAWSLVTAATGFVEGFLGLLAVRLLLGVSEAGAYPAAAGLVRGWAAADERGRFSSAVALGGRIGGAVAPYTTAFLAAALAGTFLLGRPGESANWRGVFVFYGVCGLAVAALFWLLVADAPEPGLRPPAEPFLPQLGRFAQDRNMWLFGGLLFGTNIGWAPLVTLLPTFLKEQYGVPLADRGTMQSAILFTGCLGMIAGGFVTDFLYRSLGPRRGRSLPIGFAMIACAGCLAAVPALGSPWAAVAVFGVMALFVDLSNPSIWAFAQDVGGRNVGATLGWGNMWGNLGAALSPVLMTEVQIEFGWGPAFGMCAVAFLAAAGCGFALNAARPVGDSRPEIPEE